MRKIFTFITVLASALTSFGGETADVARNIVANDIGDFNGAADMQYAFDTANNQDFITEYRVMVVKASSTFNVDSALLILPANYILYAAPLATNVLDTLTLGFTDVDGDPVVTDVDYVLYVLSTGSFGDSLSAPSNVIRLTNNIVPFPFSEDFEGGAVPAPGWAIYDEDGDGNNWRINEAGTEDAIGTYSAVTASWLGPNPGTALSPDNYMITPAIDLSDVGGASNIELSWMVVCLNQNWTGDFYSVYVSTTGGNVEDFLPANSIFNESIPGSNGFMLRSVDLSSFIGDTVWIAWRHHNSNDIERVAFDEIYLREKPDFDIAVENPSFNSEYPIMPLFQLTDGYSFSADVVNRGAKTATNVSLDVTVSNSSFNESATANTILSGATTNLNIANSFTPIDTGTYTVEFNATMDSIDQLPLSNVASESFRVTEFVMGRDKGVNTLEGSFGIGAGIDGILGQVFKFNTDVNLFSVDVYLLQPTIGDTVRIEVYEFNGVQPTLEIARSQPYTITSSEPGWRRIEFNFGSGTPLFSGSFVIGIHEFQSNITLGTSSQNFVNNANWIFYQGSWGPGENDGFEFIYFLRTNIGEFTDNVSDNVGSTLSIYPNPASNQVSLLGIDEYTTIEILDVTGKKVITLSNNGRNTSTIDVSNLEKGIYMVRATGNNSVATQKLVVE